MTLVRTLAGLDNAVLYALASRTWSIGSSFVTLAMIVRLLSPEEQGYYYTFSALLGAQILFELGMSVVVTHFASHSMAKLSWQPSGHMSGNSEELHRLSSLLKLIFRWYGLIAIVIALVLGPLGWFFLTTSEQGVKVQWEATWIWLIATTAANIFIQPLMSLLEGCQCVGQVARIRLLQSIIGSLVTWTTLLMGGGLVALATWGAATALTAVVAIVAERGKFFMQMLRLKSSHTSPISWRREIWPFQWRIALSWISGYFIFQIFVPVIFSTQGAAEAGRLGLSLAIASALMGLPLAWFNTKVPQFGQLIALRNYVELDSLWKRTTATTMMVLCAGGIAIFGLTFFLQYKEIALGNRLVDSKLMAMLLATTTLNYLMIAQASYLRAHKEEPFLWVSLAYGALVTASTLMLAKSYGSTGVLAGYLACSICCGTIWGSVIFSRRCRAYKATFLPAGTSLSAPQNQ